MQLNNGQKIKDRQGACQLAKVISRVSEPVRRLKDQRVWETLPLCSVRQSTPAFSLQLIKRHWHT